MKQRIAILVIDDEQIVLNSVKKHLLNKNYSLHTAQSVPEAMLLMARTRIDIVLTDLMMPHVDGLELMRILKERELSIPVIMMTGYAAISTARQAIESGACGYLAKPFSKSELKEVVGLAVDLVNESPDRVLGTPNADGTSGGISQLIAWTPESVESWFCDTGIESLSLATVCETLGIPIDSALDRLRQAGIPIDLESKLQEGAEAANMTVIEVLKITLIDGYTPRR